MFRPVHFKVSFVLSFLHFPIHIPRVGVGVFESCLNSNRNIFFFYFSFSGWILLSLSKGAGCKYNLIIYLL